MKTGKWILLGLLCLVLVLGLVLGPGLYRGTQMLAMAATVWNQEEFSLDIRVNEEGNLRLDWRNTHRGRVLILESSGVQVYFCDGAIYLENGKGYDFSDTVEQINQLIQSPWKLYPLVKTSREGSSWTAVLEQPDLTVTMEQGQSGIGMAWVEWDEMKVQILPQPDREVLAVPEAVDTAIAAGKIRDGEDMTGALLRLLAAWTGLSSRETIAMELALSADCGPLALADTLQICTDRETGIGYVEKDGRGLYFTPDKVCTAEGRILTQSESSVESARLLGVAYLLLLNGDFRCQGDVYSLKLDQGGMEGFAYTIAPAAEGLNIQFKSGEIMLKLEGNNLESLSVSCTGAMDLLLTEVSVSIGAELTLGETEGFTIPQPVLDALQ